MVSIEGKGFGPDEEILLDSDSAGEVLRQKVKSTSAGGYNSFILPFKKGLTQGMSKVALKSKTCAPSVSFHWGKGN